MLLILANSDSQKTIVKIYLSRLTEIKPENESFNSLCRTKDIFF